jgi:glycerol-3-phosphate acyltransferase
MAMAMSTGKRPIVHRMLNLHKIVKNNLVAGLLRFRQSTTPTTKAAPPPPPAEPLACMFVNGSKAVVHEVDALLVESTPPSATALFPPFFLVAVEAGSFARGLLLLALYPFLHLMSYDARGVRTGHDIGLLLRATARRGGKDRQGRAAQVLL